MNGGDLLAGAFDHIGELVSGVVDGLTPEQLTVRIDGESNSIAWLVWHLTRVQDDHVSEVAGAEQTWLADGWVERFGLPFAPSAIGYGQGSDDVGAVRVRSGELLTGYHDAVHARTRQFVTGLSDPEFDRIVDERWDPPVTLGVRLTSVIGDDLQHVGQAAFVRGIVERRR